MSDKIAIKQQPFRPGATNRPLTGLALRIEQAKQAAIAAGKPIEKSPSEMEHRIGIVFDDSGSMGVKQIADAIAGVEEFLRSCEKDNTAVAVYPMNMDKLALSTNLPALAILVRSIRATGGTPLVQVLSKMLSENDLTRAIVFSDGSPQGYTPEMYDAILKAGKPVDTVYISDTYGSDTRAESFMRKLAEYTDGIFLKFNSSKSNFRTAFKYLSPGMRYMLADKSFADSIQK